MSAAAVQRHETRRPEYLKLLRERSFAHVLAAYAISEAGDGVTLVAFPLLAYSLGHSAATVGFVFAVGALPRVVLGLWAGVAADRLDRRLLVTWCNVGRALLLGVVPIFPELPVILVVSFVSQSLGVLEASATEAALPALGGPRYQQLAAVRSSLRSLGTTVGPALGGVLVATVGASRAVIVDALTFAVAAALVAGVRDFDTGYGARRATAIGRHVLADLSEGLRCMLGNRVAVGLTAYWSVGLLVLPLSLVAAVPYITSDLGLSPRAYGLAVSCYAIGAVLGMLAAGKFAYRQHRRAWLLGSGLGYGGAGMALGLGPSYPIFCLLWFLWGAVYGPEQVLGDVVFAEATEDRTRGRMFSVSLTSMGLATLLGYLGSGLVINDLGARWSMGIAGAVATMAAIVAFGISPLGRAIVDPAPPKDPEEP